MKRMKPKAANTLAGDLKNTGTQTENVDNFLEIAKLEEQVRVLQLENNVLRKHASPLGFGTSKKPDDVRPVHLTPQASAKANVEKSGCGCKGNCSARYCGCVKKNSKCNPLCKCDTKVCKNQKLKDSRRITKSRENRENKENVNGITITPKNSSRKRNEDTKKTRSKENDTKKTSNKGLFSPDTKNTTRDYKDLEEDQLSDIHFSFNEKAINVTQRKLDNVNNVELKEKGQETKEENAEAPQEPTKIGEQVIFKPRHQLSRTPPKSLEKTLENPRHELSETPKSLEKPLENPRHELSGRPPNKLKSPPEKPRHRIPRTPPLENATQLHSETIREASKSPYRFEDVKEELIDWEEHTAQLVACKKCKRTFRPDRIQKHEACCKKI